MNQKRWIIAQDSERDYWEDYSKESLYEKFEKGYKKKVKYLYNNLKHILLD